MKNSHGDVIGLTDNDGTLTETYTYDAFGTLTYIQSLNEEGVLAQTDTALSRFLYAGEQYDKVSGLYYLRARRYDTTVGRFTQEDTYLGDGRNLYVYVQNNPLKYVDPSGYSTKNLGVSSSNNAWINAQNAGFTCPDSYGGMCGQAIANLLSEQIEKKLDELPLEEEQRIRDGIWNVTKGVGVIAAGAAALYTLPVTAPALAVVSTEILAGTSFAFGTSDITEGTQDYIYGSTGNTGTASFNPIRDIVFDGNQQNYDAFEFALAGATFGVGTYYSGAFSAPILSGNVAQYANVLGGAGEMLDRVDDLTNGNDSAGHRLALGLGEYLDDFANLTNSHTWKNLADPVNWKQGILTELFDANMTISFNLTGIDNVWSAITRAANGTGGATDWELFQIYSNREIWEKIIWYINNVVVPNPFT